MLYMVNKSPLMTRNLETCLAVAAKGAPILLYKDGVYAVTEGARFSEQLKAALEHHPI